MSVSKYETGRGQGLNINAVLSRLSPFHQYRGANRSDRPHHPRVLSLLMELFALRAATGQSKARPQTRRWCSGGDVSQRDLPAFVWQTWCRDCRERHDAWTTVQSGGRGPATSAGRRGTIHVVATRGAANRRKRQKVIQFAASRVCIVFPELTIVVGSCLLVAPPIPFRPSTTLSTPLSHSLGLLPRSSFYSQSAQRRCSKRYRTSFTTASRTLPARPVRLFLRPFNHLSRTSAKRVSLQLPRPACLWTVVSSESNCLQASVTDDRADRLHRVPQPSPNSPPSPLKETSPKLALLCQLPHRRARRTWKCRTPMRRHE